jgi:hypothetical protein
MVNNLGFSERVRPLLRIDVGEAQAQADRRQVQRRLRGMVFKAIPTSLTNMA